MQLNGLRVLPSSAAVPCAGSDALWPTTVPRDAVQVESHILEVK